MKSNVHPTAIIHPQSVLGDNCVIGPYCCIGEKVRIGERAQLHSHVVVDGNTTVGDDCEFFPYACIGQKTQDLKYKGGLGPVRIGSRTTIREFTTVHMPTDPDGLTQIGDDCHILAYSHIAHDCVLGNKVIMSNSSNLAGHVIIEDAVVIGGMCGIHQFTRIGQMSMIGGMSKVTQDIAPYSLADGNPAVPRTVNKIGMSRNGMKDGQIRAVMKAHKILFGEGLSQEAALEKLHAEFCKVPEVNHLIEFVKTSERGLARPRRRRGKTL